MRRIDCYFKHRFFPGQDQSFGIQARKLESKSEACFRGLRTRRKDPTAFDLIQAKEILGGMMKRLGHINKGSYRRAFELSMRHCEKTFKKPGELRACKAGATESLSKISSEEGLTSEPTSIAGRKKRR